MLRTRRDVAYLVAIAIALGFVLSRFAPAGGVGPKPTPTPVAVTATPTPGPPTDDPRVWEQPLVAGCADAADAYLVSLGGGVVRFDGQTWFLVDDTLRRMRAITCVPGLAIAVGDGGRILRIEASSQTIRPDTLGTGEEDLFAVSALDSRTITTVGSQLVLWRLQNGNWEMGDVPGSELAWRAVLMRSSKEIWFAGDKGRLALFDGAKFTDKSIADGPDLTTLAGVGVDTLVGGADGRLFSVSPAAAAKEVAKAKGSVRALVAARGGAYVVADDLGTYGFTAPPELAASGLSCQAVTGFGSGRGDLWIVARDAGREGTARFDGGAWTRWGAC